MREAATADRTEQIRARRERSITLPAAFLGVGLGGFFDGIVLHQILQWHHMLTSTGDYPATTVRGLEVNTLWDAYFRRRRTYSSRSAYS